LVVVSLTTSTSTTFFAARLRGAFAGVVSGASFSFSAFWIALLERAIRLTS